MNSRTIILVGVVITMAIGITIGNDIGIYASARPSKYVEVQQQNPTMRQMISSNQMSSSLSLGNTSAQTFNPDAPITMPMIDGYYNGTKVFFIHTEVSDKNMAEMMTKMVNFPTLYVPKLTDVSAANLSKIYVFTNGISGSEPYGGGPFMFQIDIFDSTPGQKGYSNFRVPYLVTWDNNATVRELSSVEELLKAEKRGELKIQKTDTVVNAPIISWTHQGNAEKQVAISNITNVFQTMQGFEAEVISVDTDNYIVRLMLHRLK